MRMPRFVAQFNRRVTNPLARRFAGWAPTFGIVEHVGRTSGTHYRTPVTVFRTRDGYAVLLGYGPDTQWVKNVLAADRARIRHRRRSHVVTHPRVMTKAEAAPLISPGSRLLYRLFPFDESTLVLTEEEDA